ncbi:MAG TPA: type I 3-dehydroquinate dehydratase [Planctomycetota bacterium]|nr:type I 3-dehydroquinate dehydratase [Planctomycetota bacterium]
MALVVSILADDFDLLARRALRAAPTADMIELRLDRLPDVSESELSRLFAAIAKPAIVAVNGPQAYGSFAGSAADRRAILQRCARAGAAFVDIDWREASDFPPWGGSTRRIVSRHEIRLAGSARELERELRANARSGDWRKLVVEARSGEECLEILALLDGAQGDLIAFASGATGSFTRIVAPILGSPLSYAALDPAEGEVSTPTAPGQLLASQMREAWPSVGVSTSTQIFAVLGNPIAHSISPRVHTRALRAAGTDAVFVAVEVTDLAKTLALCSSKNWRGFAVTAPHKQAAFELAVQHDAASLRARASNTLVKTSAGWSAHNTDVVGVLGAALAASRGESLAGQRALILGAGGAARSALVALESLGAKSTVCARDLQRSSELAREFGASAIAWEARAATPFEIIVQCTPAQTAGAEPLLADTAIAPGSLVVESIYRPLQTPLLAAASRRGAAVATGAEWFTHQAERQFEILTGQNAPRDLIREEVLRALA